MSQAETQKSTTVSLSNRAGGFLLSRFRLIVAPLPFFGIFHEFSRKREGVLDCFPLVKLAEKIIIEFVRTL